MPLLDAIAADGPIDGQSTALVVAHPDDETIGAGGLLSRLSAATVVHVTDGAPRDMIDARRLGFASADDYAEARHRELDAALDIADVTPENRVHFGHPDKAAVHALADIVAALEELILTRRITTVVTHAYEGGHPDHDAVAVAVATAVRALGQRGVAVETIAFPLYRLGERGPVGRSFPTTGMDRPDHVVTRHLSESERATKRAMSACFETQADIVARFAIDVELFAPVRVPPRPATAPNGGAVLYEGFGWGLTWRDWSRAAHAALWALSRRGAA